MLTVVYNHKSVLGTPLEKTCNMMGPSVSTRKANAEHRARQRERGIDVLLQKAVFSKVFQKFYFLLCANIHERNAGSANALSQLLWLTPGYSEYLFSAFKDFSLASISRESFTSTTASSAP
jgi:hypothetical protein